MARPSHQSSQSSAPAPSTADIAAPTLSFNRIPLTIPSIDTCMSDSILWAPALDASLGLPDLTSDTFDPSEHPNLFDDLGVHRRAFQQLLAESATAQTEKEEEPDLVILGSTPPSRLPPVRRRAPLRATLVPHADEVTMPTIGSVGGFRRTRHLFQELTGSSPLSSVQRVLPPSRPLTVADFAGEPFRYPPTNRGPENPPAWKRTAAAAEFAAAICSRGAAQATMHPGINSARGYQYPSPSTPPQRQGLTFAQSVGTAATINPAPWNNNRSAARPPRSHKRPVRRNTPKRDLVHVQRWVVMSDADATQKVQFDLVQRCVNAQNAYLKMVLVKNYYLALADISKGASKL